MLFAGPPSLELTVEGELAQHNGRRYLRARDGGGKTYTLVEGGAAPAWEAAVPDRRVLRPVRRRTDGDTPLFLYERPGAISVNEWLAEETPPAPLDVLSFGINLCEVMQGLHGAGRCAGSLDPDLVLRTPTLDALLAGLEDLPTPGHAPAQMHPQTAAPEVLHRLGPLCGLASDVYAVAAVLHALFAGHPLWRPPSGMSAVMTHQYAPRTWRQDLPLGIWPRLAPALDPDPARRLPHLHALWSALGAAERAVRKRTARAPVPLPMDGWADSHIGVGKARRGGDQQDRLFCGLGVGATLALGAVADGVSHATLGDGGSAAEHTATAVRALFDQISGGTKTPVQPAGLQERERLLHSVMDQATALIADDANSRGRLQGDPAGVMASTLVMVLVEDGVASVFNVGDSRAYLFDGQVCESLAVDHDRRAEAVRAGMDPYGAHGLEAGGALTRAVGRVVVEPDGQLRASPSTADVFHYVLLPGDRLVLCSDGLSDFTVPMGRSLLSPVAVEQVVAKLMASHPDVAEAAHALIGLANHNGGHDNVAVVVLQVGGS